MPTNQAPAVAPRSAEEANGRCNILPFPSAPAARSSRPQRLRALAPYFATVLASLLTLTWTLQLGKANLRIPLAYGGDALLYQTLVKGVVEQGWYLHNARVGAPGSLDLHDFPESDNLHFLLLKLLGYMVRNSVLAYNLFYLLTYPLTALTSLYVFRRFGLTFGPALVGSLLFAFLPYHLRRNVEHLFLTAYYMIPLMVAVLLDLALGRPPFFEPDAVTGKPRFGLGGRRALAAVAVCVLTAVAGVYYACFACSLLPVAGLAGSFRRGRPQALWASLLLLGVIGASALVNATPTFLYRWQNGANPWAVTRTPVMAETFGLKITTLLFPVQNHRLTPLRDFRNRYSIVTLPTVNENDFATLGAVGAVGFLLLMGGLLFLPRTGRRFALLNGLSVLSAAAVLLGTISGFGAIFNYLLFDWIRAYNRISVYIAFFSLFATAWLLEMAYRKYVHSRRSSVVYHSLIGLVLVLGLLDVTSDLDVPLYASVKQIFLTDEHYVRSIESAVPPGTMIFQLPYLPFPEGPPVHQLGSYEHFRGFLHSRTLRWSFGAMKGREWDLWQQDLAARPVDELVERLCFAGFGGIHVDRGGYADGGVALEQRLAAALGVAPLVSADGRCAFYSLAAYNARHRASLTEVEWEEKQDRALHPVLLQYAGGFYERESRWCSSKGQLIVSNHGRRPRVVSLEVQFRSVLSPPVELRIDGNLFAEKLAITNVSGHFCRVITVPPGDHRLYLECDGPIVIPPNDPRSLVFRVESVKLTEQ